MDDMFPPKGADLDPDRRLASLASLPRVAASTTTSATILLLLVFSLQQCQGTAKPYGLCLISFQRSLFPFSFFLSICWPAIL